MKPPKADPRGSDSLEVRQINFEMTAKRAVRQVQRQSQSLAWQWRWGRKPYRAYYRYMVDEAATCDPQGTVGGLWEVMGKLQLDFLRSQGLRPEHSMLDIGCGCLRGGLHFIRYLEPRHYWGLDLSPNILEAGRQFLKEAELDGRQPHLILTDSFGLNEVEGQKFDFILAFGVFTDLPAECIRESFANLHKVLSSGATFFATFRPHRRYLADPVRVEFGYPISFFEQLGKEHGYSVAMVEGFKHPRGHKMMVVRCDSLEP